ncbi:MAG: hypothetical protein GY814_02935 [Gammaproteobacteria bacterium]|nr:hypothetical protein [Gammaproteobacteria bacterium]
MPEYTPLNKELFKEGKKIMNKDAKPQTHKFHWGWCELSLFINYLEENYTIIKRGSHA